MAKKVVTSKKVVVPQTSLRPVAPPVQESSQAAPANLLITVDWKDNGVPASLVANTKEFKTGSRGYFCNGKVEVNGKRYQANFMLIEIGSKPSQSE